MTTKQCKRKDERNERRECSSAGNGLYSTVTTREKSNGNDDDHTENANIQTSGESRVRGGELTPKKHGGNDDMLVDVVAAIE